MKSFKIFLLAALAVFFVACKDSITPSTEEIEGPLGDYFEVVSKDYKIENGKMAIEFKRVKDGMPAPWNMGMLIGTSSGECAPVFHVEFYDGDGNVVCKDSTDLTWDVFDLGEIVALSVSKTGTLTFDCGNSEKIKSFKVTSTFEVHPDDNSFGSAAEAWVFGNYDNESSDDSSDDSETASSSSSEDWDAVLDSYESYVDEYIDFVERAKNDPSVLSESASLVAKAQEFGDKLEKAQDDMSSAQVARYVKLSTKFSKAISSLY